MFVASLNAGCGQATYYTPRSLPASYQARFTPSASQLDLSQLATEPSGGRRVAPGDVLDVAVQTGLAGDQTERSVSIRVNDQGQVHVPLIGPVPVAGLELTGAEQRIRADGIRRGIYRDPSVTVTFAERKTRQVTVIGAVNEPGVKQLPVGESTLFSALVAAGGMEEDAATIVEVRHAVPSYGVQRAGWNAESAPTRSPVDRVDLAAGDQRSGTVVLEEGAVVSVARRPPSTVQVLGLVKQPAELKMPHGKPLRLLDAVAQAGGLSMQIANKVHIIRHVPGQAQPAIIHTTIREAKALGSANLVLSEGDVVSVEQTPLTFTVDMLQSFIRFGFTGALPGI